MNRVIKFRGKRIDNGEWVEGSLILCGKSIIRWVHNPLTNDYTDIEVHPETVGQFTGLHDKDGKEIWEGDIVQYKYPYRTTQTHTGDNIPNGSYTEPMEPGIKIVSGVVKYKNGAFVLDLDSNENSLLFFLFDTKWDLYNIQSAISYMGGHRFDILFDDPEEGDLQYLIQECAKVQDANALIEYLNAIEIIGNIYDNPELI